MIPASGSKLKKETGGVCAFDFGSPFLRAPLAAPRPSCDPVGSRWPSRGLRTSLALQPRPRVKAARLLIGSWVANGSTAAFLSLLGVKFSSKWMESPPDRVRINHTSRSASKFHRSFLGISSLSMFHRALLPSCGVTAGAAPLAPQPGGDRVTSRGPAQLPRPTAAFTQNAPLFSSQHTPRSLR